MPRVQRATVRPDRVHRALPELLPSSDGVAVSAEASDIVVGVGSALAQRDDVIGNRGLNDQASLRAVSAERLSSKAAEALLNPSAATKALCALGCDVVRTSRHQATLNFGPIRRYEISTIRFMAASL